MFVDKKFFDDVMMHQQGVFGTADMFERVARINKVEAILLKSCVFKPCMQPGEIRFFRPLTNHTFIGFNPNNLSHWKIGFQLKRKRTTIGANIKYSQRFMPTEIWLQRRQISLGSKAFAVSQIAPVRAS